MKHRQKKTGNAIRRENFIKKNKQVSYALVSQKKKYKKKMKERRREGKNTKTKAKTGANKIP